MFDKAFKIGLLAVLLFGVYYVGSMFRYAPVGNHGFTILDRKTGHVLLCGSGKFMEIDFEKRTLTEGRANRFAIEEGNIFDKFADEMERK